jgi:trk system potassium uptake protein TrkH
LRNAIANLFRTETLYKVTFIFSVLGVLLFIADYGFDKSVKLQRLLNGYYLIVLLLGIAATAVRYLKQKKTITRGVVIFDILSILIISIILFTHFLGEEANRHLSFLYNDDWVKFAIILTFIREFSEQHINFNRTLLNPAQLYIASFL